MPKVTRRKTLNQHNLDGIDRQLVASMYQVVSSRRLGYDTLIWQVPAISFTAQAFLFSIALGTTSITARFISASLAFIIAVISMQLMSKHRYHEEIDSRLLERFEKEQRLEMIFGCAPHAAPKRRAQVVGMTANWITSKSSYRLWQYGLTLFALAAISIIVITVIGSLTSIKLLP